MPETKNNGFNQILFTLDFGGNKSLWLNDTQ
jgi:hypothetical protein